MGNEPNEAELEIAAEITKYAILYRKHKEDWVVSEETMTYQIGYVLAAHRASDTDALVKALEQSIKYMERQRAKSNAPFDPEALKLARAALVYHAECKKG